MVSVFDCSLEVFMVVGLLVMWLGYLRVFLVWCVGDVIGGCVVELWGECV